MKKNVFFVLILFSFFSVNRALAQFSRPVSVGIGGGGTISLADLANVEVRFAGYAEADWLLSPFISVGLHGEKGVLSGHGWSSDFENKYYALTANGKVRLGQFLSLPENYSYYTLGASTFSKILANLYVGAGAGVLKNSIENNIASSYKTSTMNMGGEFPEDLDGYNFVVPLNIGLDIPFGRTLYGPKWAVNLNYQHMLTTTDNLDGVVNRQKDQYGYVSLGVKLALFNRN